MNRKRLELKSPLYFNRLFTGLIIPQKFYLDISYMKGNFWLYLKSFK